MAESKIYFPNLNGLRFIAALMVIVHHIEQIKLVLKDKSYKEIDFFNGIMGTQAVIFFFVLSGFLITYLLLLEEKQFKFINIKQFYKRRILRIWPLYFFIIFLAFFVLPHISLFNIYNLYDSNIYKDLIKKLALFIFLLPNIALSIYSVPYAAQTWSIGCEEQFYIFWPIVLKYIKTKRLTLMISIFLIYTIIEKVLMLEFFKNLPYLSIFKL